MMFQYQFPKANLTTVSEHAASLDVVVYSLITDGPNYIMTTENSFPEDQLEHLDMTRIA